MAPCISIIIIPQVLHLSVYFIITNSTKLQLLSTIILEVWEICKQGGMDPVVLWLLLITPFEFKFQTLVRGLHDMSCWQTVTTVTSMPWVFDFISHFDVLKSIMCHFHILGIGESCITYAFILLLSNNAVRYVMLHFFISYQCLVAPSASDLL